MTAASPRIGSLFTGYGGLDLGVTNALGGTVSWHCEINPAAVKVLDHHWPDVPNVGDITNADWSEVQPVDVLTGGFPCQDVSSAGRRAGLRSGTRSGLWANMAGAVDALRPRLVVIENVPGLLSAAADSDVEPCPWCMGDRSARVLRALGAVLGDLADLGYDARWCGVRASDVGAPHRRHRVFVVAADAHDLGHQWARSSWDRRARPADGRAPVAHADAEGRTGQPAATLRQGTADVGGCPHGIAAQPWGKYGPAIRHWGAVLGRPAPPAAMQGRGGAQVLSPAFVEWMQGLPRGHVTDVDDLTRADMLRLLGNGVVPQQAAHALALLSDDGDVEKAVA